MSLFSLILQIAKIFHNTKVFFKYYRKGKKKDIETFCLKIYWLLRFSSFLSQLGNHEYPSPAPDHRPPRNVTLKNMYVTMNNNKGKQNTAHFTIG